MAEDSRAAPARVIHHTATRTRLRVEGATADTDYLPSVISALEAHPQVTQVLCNPLTSTVLVHHHADLSADDVFALGEELGCFTVPQPVVRGTPIQELRRLYRQTEDDAMRLSNGHLDVESVSLALLLGSAMTGFVRGNVAFPAATALWYALDLIRQRSTAEPEDPVRAP